MYCKCFNSIVAVTHVYRSAPYIQTVHGSNYVLSVHNYPQWCLCQERDGKHVNRPASLQV